MDYETYMRKSLLAAWLTCFTIVMCAQEGVTTLGIQLKPMFPSSFFGSGAYSAGDENLTVTFNPERGFAFGMVVRHGITKNWSFESGINFVQRNYRIDFQYARVSEFQQVDFRFVGYEIPVQGLLYVRLGNQWWMNAAAGISLDMYPSNVISQREVFQDTVAYIFVQRSYRTRWLQVAALANLGFEYRSKKSGYFYFGASYHRPFAPIGITEAFVQSKLENTGLFYDLIGTYLTADFRYFFHEDPERKRPKSK
jgi:hypothetical protein